MFTNRNQIKICEGKILDYFKQKLTYIAEATAIHRWFQISHSTHLNARLWQFILLFCIGLALYGCIKSIIFYYKLEINTSISFNIESEMRFPGITFCPTFQLLKSKAGSNEMVILALSEISALSWEQGMKSFKTVISYNHLKIPNRILSNITIIKPCRVLFE